MCLILLTVLAIYVIVLVCAWILLVVLGLALCRFKPVDAVLFATIQALAGRFAPLGLAGYVICAVLAYSGNSHWSGMGQDAKLHWPAWAWLWDNQEDGTAAQWFVAAHPTWSLAHCQFAWTTGRNSVNNFRFVPGVSKVGRPLWRKTWGATPGGWYAQAGWNPSGYPVLSAGRNIHPW